MTGILIAVAVLSVLIGFMQWLHWQERRDLYNRLMARDLADYRAVTSGELPRVRNPLRKKIEERQG